jgi:hypothetical protein
MSHLKAEIAEAIREKRWEDLKAHLQTEAMERWPDDEDRRRVYVFGTMRKAGWKPSREK